MSSELFGSRLGQFDLEPDIFCSIGRSPSSGCGGTGSRRGRTGGVGEVGVWVWDGRRRRVGMSAECRAGR